MNKTKQVRELEQKRKYKYAVGFMIEQEGTGVVERLVRDGTKTRFGVRESWIPGRSLEDLNRSDAEDLLRNREWDFYNYNQIGEALTVPTKIFDTHITFSPQVAIEAAQSALGRSGIGVEKTGTLNRETRRAIEEVRPQNFFANYIEILENYVNSNHDGREALLRRVRQIPYRNVNASDT